MRSKLLLPLLTAGMLLLTTSCTQVPNEHADTKRVGLNGAVKSHHTYIYETKQGADGWEKDTTDYAEEAYLYNERGEFTQGIMYHNGEQTYLFKNDRKNDRIVTQHVYDVSGELIQTMLVSHKEDTAVYTAKDVSGFCRSINTEVSADGRLATSTISIYDPAKGKEPVMTIFVTYDKGWLTTEVCTFTDTLSGRNYSRGAKYVAFDAKGNWTTQLLFDVTDTTNPVMVKERTYTYYE